MDAENKSGRKKFSESGSANVHAENNTGEAVVELLAALKSARLWLHLGMDGNPEPKIAYLDGIIARATERL